MDCSEFLLSAESFAQANTEIGYRNAASRAYYCAYHASLVLAEELAFADYIPGRTDKIGAHERLIKRIQFGALSLSEGVKQKVSQVAHFLAQAKVLRVKADYKLGIEICKGDCDLTIAYSKKILSLIDDVARSFAA